MTIEITEQEMQAVGKIYKILSDIKPYVRVLVMRSVWTLSGCDEIAPILDEETKFRQRELEAEAAERRRLERKAIREALKAEKAAPAERE